MNIRRYIHRILLVFSLILSVLGLLNGQINTPLVYALPIQNTVSFSGGFGELRRNHFHTGLDFRTAGQIGLPVFAVNEGYVTRVAVSSSGYGLALYLLHPDGHTTVYGHLSRFHPRIEAYVKERQYLVRQFVVDLTLPSGLFPFKKGEIIAWSGNSGSSGGPHLHFEIRGTQSEKPVNPLFYLPAITDKSSPRINLLYIYSQSICNNNIIVTRKQRFETINSNKRTTLKNRQSIEVFGDIGIGIQTDDDFNGTGMKCGTYSIELYLDQQPVFSFKMDRLAFDQGRYINSHIDYEELIKNKRWIHKLYLQPGNKMEIYQSNEQRGLLKLSDGKSHDVKIVVSDINGNTNVLTFKLVQGTRPLVKANPVCTKLFYWDKPNMYENDEVKIDLPEGTLYENLPFVYHKDNKSGNFFSAVHQIHHSYVPVHKPYLLSIKAQSILPKLQSKALVASIDPFGRYSSLGGEFQNGWVLARPRVFGNFTVVLDTVPPKIQSISIKENKTLLNKKRIAFKITDNLSGIGSYKGEIDGKWALFEYDAKSATIEYIIDEKRIDRGKMHQLQLTVEDERKNSAAYKASFYL